MFILNQDCVCLYHTKSIRFCLSRLFLTPSILQVNPIFVENIAEQINLLYVLFYLRMVKPRDLKE